MGTKIATCSYCGTRAALVFDRGRHELTCQACGAPLHEMKAMPTVSAARKTQKTQRNRPAASGRARRRTVHEEDGAGIRRPRRRKRRKPRMRRIAEEVWDLFEDIFD